MREYNIDSESTVGLERLAYLIFKLKILVNFEEFPLGKEVNRYRVIIVFAWHLLIVGGR